MTGSKKVIDALQALLKAEFIAIHQYTAESRWFKVAGYVVLAKAEMSRAETEMHHASKLMRRLVQLGTMPVVDGSYKVALESDVSDILAEDEQLEAEAVAQYNAGVATCLEDDDAETRSLFEHILKDETKHLEGVNALQTQLTDMGKANFLSTMV